MGSTVRSPYRGLAFNIIRTTRPSQDFCKPRQQSGQSPLAWHESREQQGQGCERPGGHINAKPYAVCKVTSMLQEALLHPRSSLCHLRIFSCYVTMSSAQCATCNVMMKVVLC